MASRQELQIMLEKVFESTNVYYQPPQNVQISYPAIKYSKKKPDTKHANNKKYLKKYDDLVKRLAQIDKQLENLRSRLMKGQ